jgi:hypothetical protein
MRFSTMAFLLLLEGVSVYKIMTLKLKESMSWKKGCC